ncbi:conserved hypothetical protein [Paenibacillus curdlanolyticus YK9]|uniref:Membrane protein YqhR n=1 Tax=Paenibacillus curdlanolyticus YK9 TaxID=717606 RepID=E0ICL1_9BACL|nr:YqhR family membrane protein [Paenibacillus curdlanolyticus]EFM09897.1 conserved hypothetical protein [Paenibacillus curdlanolyticus YK9]
MARQQKHAVVWSPQSHKSGQKSQKHARNDQGDSSKKHTNPLTFCLSLGFFAGLIWGVVRGVSYWLQFTKVMPGMLAEPFFKHSFLDTGWGYAVGIAVFIVFSMIAALLYYALFGRLAGPYMGIIYGLLWWVAIFAALGPAMKITPALTVIGWDTLLTELCVFTLWGVFIGYSIAFEFTDEASREPIGSKASQSKA